MSLYHTNLGTESTDDELWRAKKLWESDLLKIAALDNEIAEVLSAQE